MTQVIETLQLPCNLILPPLWSVCEKVSEGGSYSHSPLSFSLFSSQSVCLLDLFLVPRSGPGFFLYVYL